ncbi:tripartite tricarboxylate transporter TctB family protein [Haladaptatus sp. DFWS20]|uniref:tripartite tricarboxylate transporter TctB family protein n=1 Tax=Haladaptatus sp. DFWS20 TaxID=3403467 RepID=UPI003EBC16B3
MVINKEKIRSNPLALVFIAVSTAVILFASQFPSNGQVGPGFFPIIISAGIIVFAVVDLMVDDDTELEMSNFDFKAAVLVFILLLLYLGLMPILGFLVGTIAFLPIILYYSGIRSKITIISISICLPVALFYIFSRFFLVRLPEGIIPFSRLLPTLPLGVIL